MIELMLYPSGVSESHSYRYIKFENMYADPGQLVGLNKILILNNLGEDLCAKNSATATASSSYDSGLDIKHVVNYSLAWRWVSREVGPQWVLVDLKTKSTFHSIKMYIYAPEPKRSPKSFELLGSNDNVTFQSLGYFTDIKYPDVIQGTSGSVKGTTITF